MPQAAATNPAKRATRHATRTTQLRTAHELARQVDLETREGHDRGEYETMLRALIGRTSLRQATRSERETVINFFREAVAEREAHSKHRPVHAAEDFSDDACLDLLGEAA